MDVKVGVINPYALGEMVAERHIKWDRVTEPQKMLSDILNIEEDAIFDIKNPILNPNIQVEADGKVKVLSEAQGKTRLNSFLKVRSPHPTVSRLAAGSLPAAVEARLPDMLLASAVGVSKSSTPWKPTDKEWIDKGDYFEDVAEVNDPIQGALGDCYYIAALSSVAWARPYIIVNMIRPSGWGNETNPIHKTNFYKNGTGSPQSVEVSEKVPVAKTSHAWVYARSLDSTEIWPAVMEKAYAKWRTGNTTDFPNYPAISGGDPVMACAQLIRGKRTYKGNAGTSANALWTFVRGNSLSRRTVNPMVAWTYSSQPAGTNYASAHVVANHAYSVLGWDYYNNEKYIVLRNPWGTHHATLDTRPGTWSAHQVSYWAPIPLNSNGVFSMKAATFKKYFAGTGVTV
ncbi:MAG: hypothetical protein K9N55_11130 [Phycisphaerae bacterium]|nr:hypothetical protein [Phycisphaerae bacterium]